MYYILEFHNTTTTVYIHWTIALPTYHGNTTSTPGVYITRGVSETIVAINQPRATARGGYGGPVSGTAYSMCMHCTWVKGHTRAKDVSTCV